MRGLLWGLTNLTVLNCSPSIQLTITEDTPVSASECAYLVSLPASDSLCVAADHLAHKRGFNLVKFHLVRDSASQRLAILGCADSSCSPFLSQEDTAVSDVSSGAVSSTWNSLSVSSSSWSCCSVASAIEAPPALVSSLQLPAACYRVLCIPASSVPVLPGSSQLLLPWKAGQQLGEHVSDVTISEFVLFKFRQFSVAEKAMFVLVVGLFIYLSSRGYWTLRSRRLKRLSLNAALARTSQEVEQPFEVTLNPGESDTVEFLSWQNASDLDKFNRKMNELKYRVSKIPFAHATDADSVTRGGTEGSSVVFLGRNVDDPKMVFRNPRTEKEQRANIPIHTQAIRNAVIASVLRESPRIKAYVPRAVVGRWNRVEGVFQEYVSTAKSVSLQEFRENENMAVDLGFLVMLVRDTDAHEGNYVRDARRKVALYDLGCSLGDRPLPRFDRECLDNFEVLMRLPGLLDRGFEERHVEFLKDLEIEKVKEMWRNFEYDDYLVRKVEGKKKDVKGRGRASSSIFPLSSTTSPRSIPAFIGGLLSPRMRPAEPNESKPSMALLTLGTSVFGSPGSAGSTSTSGTGAAADTMLMRGGSQLGSPKSTRSLPTSEFFPTGWESSDEEEDEPRLCSVLDMLRVLEMHAKFLLRCAEKGKTMLFAAKVLYSGFYDERWLELGGRMEDIEKLEEELLKVASADLTQPPTLKLDLHVDDLDLDASPSSDTEGSRVHLEELVLATKDIQ